MDNDLLQGKEELERLYERDDDPWGYKNTSVDQIRLGHLSRMLGAAEVERTLDIGSGNGFVTEKLPGIDVIGIDISENAVRHARKSALDLDLNHITYVQADLLQLQDQEMGEFDLICITGVLYEQYIGRSDYLVREVVDKLLRQGGLLVSCHIDEWRHTKFGYQLIDTDIYRYSDFWHRLELYQK